MIEDFKLSKHLSFYEATKTSNLALQEKNRICTAEEIDKLKIVGLTLVDRACEIIKMPAIIHCGRRMPDLNAATQGASPTSQHPKCEAVDLHFQNVSVLFAFQALVSAAKEGQIKFGQLLIEEYERDYGVAEWLHLSLGQPYREKEKCGQVGHGKNGLVKIDYRIEEAA